MKRFNFPVSSDTWRRVRAYRDFLRAGGEVLSVPQILERLLKKSLDIIYGEEK